MSTKTRPIQPADIEACGQAAWKAHQHVAALHNVPPEHPSADFSTRMIAAKFKDPGAQGWIAEDHGLVLGSVFLNFIVPSKIAAIGPLTVAPEHAGGVGRLLMETALQHADALEIPSVRLVQSPSHLRSLALYSKLGFDARSPLVLMQGHPVLHGASELVRAATMADIGQCETLCEKVHGFSRGLEVRKAVGSGTAWVTMREGRVRGYTTGIGLLGHGVAETSADLLTLVAGAPALPGPGFFLPIFDSTLLQWAFANGLRAGWSALLMVRGTYQEPAGAFIPSIAC